MKNYLYNFVDLLSRPLIDIFFPRYSIIYGEDPVDNPKEKVIYVVGSKNEPWQVELLCPCGCKDKIVLPLNSQTSPRWNLRVDNTGIPDLSPSIWRSKGCKSHFFLKNGKIQWCPKYYAQPRD